MNTKVLDCTLRDGGYYNNWDFPISFVNRYLNAISKTSTKFVEIGFRGIDYGNKNKGKFWYTTNSTISSLKIPKNLSLGVMINASDYITKNRSIDLKNLKKNFHQKKKIKFVRIAFHFKECKNAIEICKYIKGLGYISGLNLMQISRLKTKEIGYASKQINKVKPDVFYIADSLGDVNEKLLIKINKEIRKFWKGQLGIHAHDNLRCALKNTLKAKKLEFTWLDSTVLGMGRGPGNVKTERLLPALNLKKGQNDLNNFIKKNFLKYLNIYNWGTNKYYKLSANKKIHPTYVQEMLSDDRYKSNDITFVLEKIKNSYFYDPNILDNFKKKMLLNFNNQKKFVKKIKPITKTLYQLTL